MTTESVQLERERVRGPAGLEEADHGQHGAAVDDRAAALAQHRVVPTRRARVTRYPISIWETTVSMLSSPISLAHVPYRYPRCPYDMVDKHIDMSYPISIYHIAYR